MVIASDPGNGAQGVDRAARLRVFFDRLLLPLDVHRGHVLLRSGELSVFVELRYDPIERAVIVESESALDPDVVWRLRVEGLRDLDRREMEPWEIAFRTGSEAIGEDPEAVSFADVAPIFEARCASAECHAGPSAVLGLDLSSAEGVRSTAVGVAAQQARVGVSDRPWLGTSTLAGLARVEVVAGVGRPGDSYLVYKVLGDPHVWGARMPPEPEPPLGAEELDLLGRWIQAGAPTD